MLLVKFSRVESLMSLAWFSILEIAELEAADVQPWQIGCGISPLLPQEAIEKEIAEFEANLAKELADKAA
jgi:hypothetical protein